MISPDVSSSQEAEAFCPELSNEAHACKDRGIFTPSILPPLS